MTTPLLIISDSPTAGTGLGRITADIASLRSGHSVALVCDSSLLHLPPLTWSIAYGIILILGILHNIPSPERKDDSFSATITQMIASGIIYPWISVGIGWIIK